MKRIIVFLVIACLTFLAGCHNADNGRTDVGYEEENNMSFKEISRVLEGVGISGFDEEMILELEEDEYYQTCTALEKTETLLALIGEGDFDEETGEWIPASNGVFSFDIETYDLDSMYTNLLRGVKAIGGGELDFDNIREKSGILGKTKISFDWSGTTYELKAKKKYDWYDLNVMNELADIVKNQGGAKWLYFSNSGQAGLVFYGDQEWVEKFEGATGIALGEKIE